MITGKKPWEIGGLVIAALKKRSRVAGIGNNVLIGSKVQIYTAYHPLDPDERLTGRELAASIAIGNNVWIGGGAIICQGVAIGDDSTIGAGSREFAFAIIPRRSTPQTYKALGIK
ncbi:MAG: DapH/DapD/GlmU-related protein [Prochloraceae cyanobacterium]|nr:DapH/DapD/GlmU-related protein [Prochloraceae cyanobacterium]